MSYFVPIQPARLTTTTPTHCLVCGAAVDLVAGFRHHVLIEEIDGRRTPHACPPGSASRYMLREALRRVVLRREAALRRARSNPEASPPGVTGSPEALPLSPQEVKEVSKSP